MNLDNMSVSVQQQDFDVSAELRRLRDQSAQVGAVASFVGVVRDINDSQTVSVLELEHYPGMTEQSIADIIIMAGERWQLVGARVIHRVGKLLPTDQIVLVAVTSRHRGDAFAACEFIMDYLKTRAPFWKKEQTEEGARWLDARSADQAAVDRWEQSD
ncbi:Molybdopterin biosynthesis MoaE [marine gamma proteobacterium HTCC2143]|uniref:Molybdopterin synthase catalytic subunit n=1 Tax=marine gamma proteobacterium HTCC2143 TaxID=247633 RepID=A0YDA8_9GAMM|nr:Molybdopterin biosynthesis MoaE [marine gamma proteobacterium HTCC2143]